MNALAQVGPLNGATCLYQSAILKHLGKHAFNKMGKLKLSQYLADLEEKYGLVVYVAGAYGVMIFLQLCSHLWFHDEQSSYPKAMPLMVICKL
jgi:lysophospholipid hydrolase